MTVIRNGPSLHKIFDEIVVEFDLEHAAIFAYFATRYYEEDLDICSYFPSISEIKLKKICKNLSKAKFIDLPYKKRGI